MIEAYPGPVATGENLFSVPDVKNLLLFGGMRPRRDIFQMDAGLSYGLTEYIRMLELLEAHGYQRAQAHPHGGHLINLHIAAGLGLGGCEAYPGVFQPFGGYPARCGIDAGMVHPTDAPGFGLEEKEELQGLIGQLAGKSSLRTARGRCAMLAERPLLTGESGRNRSSPGVEPH